MKKTRAREVLQGYEFGSFLAVRVRAVGAKDPGPWSLIRHRCAVLQFHPRSHLLPEFGTVSISTPALMKAASMSFLRPVVIAVAGIMAVISAGFAVLMVFFVAVFFGNFNFSKWAHSGIFFGTCLFIATAYFASVTFLRRRTARSCAFVLVAAGLAVLTFWLWSIPEARGLIH